MHHYHIDNDMYQYHTMTSFMITLWHAPLSQCGIYHKLSMTCITMCHLSLSHCDFMYHYHTVMSINITFTSITHCDMHHLSPITLYHWHSFCTTTLWHVLLSFSDMFKYHTMKCIAITLAHAPLSYVDISLALYDVFHWH